MMRFVISTLILLASFACSAAFEVGNVYTWDDKMALLKAGMKEESRDIPCPCIWNNPRKKGSIEHRNRTWNCAAKDNSGECTGVIIIPDEQQSETKGPLD